VVFSVTVQDLVKHRITAAVLRQVGTTVKKLTTFSGFFFGWGGGGIRKIIVKRGHYLQYVGPSVRLFVCTFTWNNLAPLERIFVDLSGRGY